MLSDPGNELGVASVSEPLTVEVINVSNAIHSLGFTPRDGPQMLKELNKRYPEPQEYEKPE